MSLNWGCYLTVSATSARCSVSISSCLSLLSFLYRPPPIYLSSWSLPSWTTGFLLSPSASISISQGFSILVFSCVLVLSSSCLMSYPNLSMGCSELKKISFRSFSSSEICLKMSPFLCFYPSIGQYQVRIYLDFPMLWFCPHLSFSLSGLGKNLFGLCTAGIVQFLFIERQDHALKLKRSFRTFLTFLLKHQSPFSLVLS